MQPYKNMVTCALCSKDFQFGPHAYDGTHLSGYGLTVCRSCYNSNWDGWAPRNEKIILAHLSSRGVRPPARNSAGWLPRDWPQDNSSA